jgi:hypothetical protein
MADQPDPDDPSTLRIRQDERAAEEAVQAHEADAPAEARAHRRRAEKAAYLRDKLGEAERSKKE